MATLFFCPLESFSIFILTILLERPTAFRHLRHSRCSISPNKLAIAQPTLRLPSAPQFIFCPTVNSSMSLKSCHSDPIFRIILSEHSLISLPLRITSPVVGRKDPLIMLSRVVFPEPLLPSKAI